MTEMIHLVASRFGQFATLAGYALCYISGLALLTWAALHVAEYFLKATRTFAVLIDFAIHRKQFRRWRDKNNDE